jgi:hypothetical protein
MPRPQAANTALDGATGEFYCYDGGAVTPGNSAMELGDYHSPFERNRRDPDAPGFAAGLVTSPQQDRLLTQGQERTKTDRETLAAQQWGFSVPGAASPPRPGELTKPIERLPELSRGQLEYHQRRQGVVPLRAEEGEALEVAEGEALTQAQCRASREFTVTQQPHSML